METQFTGMQTLFVETSAFTEIMKILTTNRLVVINGNPGDGKTTLAYRAMHFLTTTGKRPLEVNIRSGTDWEILTNSSKENLVILVDNIFGEYSVSSDSLSQWSHQRRVLQNALSHEERTNYLIITIRSEVYRQCGETLATDTFFNSAMINISLGGKYGVSDKEMESIFYKYIPGECIPKSGWLQVSDHVQKLGFQQCCRLYKEIPELREMGIRFFANPLPSLRKVITIGLNSGDMDIAVLVLIFLYGGHVKECILKNNDIDLDLKIAAMKMCSIQHNNLQSFSEAIINIKSSFVVKTKEMGEEYIRFSHSSIQSTLFFVTGKQRPDELIQNCHHTILSMMTTSRSSRVGIESMHIPDQSLPVLYKRVCDLLSAKSQSSDVFKVIADLYVWKDDRFFEQFLNFDHFLKPVDENGLSMFVHFSAVGCLKWVTKLHNRITQHSILSLALQAACGANKVAVVDFFLQNGVGPDIESSFNAVKGGHLQIIRKLEAAGLDLTQVCKSQTEWITTTSVLEEAALQNQCHLIAPLLQLCSKLIDIKSSIGASAIHFVASAGDVPLLKTLIEENNFSPYDKSDIGSTILHFASQNNRFEAVKYIIETYPSLVLQKYYCYQQGTILHTAAQSGNCDMFKYIFDQNIKILKSNEVDVIHLERDCYVLMNDKETEVVDRSMLLHVKDNDGKSIVHRAAWSRSVQLVQFLVDNGIDVVGSVTKQGDSVLDFAKKRNDNKDMIDFLQEHFFK